MKRTERGTRVFKLYSEKSVRELILRMKEEYDGVVRGQRELIERLKEENRTLLARLSVLEGERGEVSDALVHAVKEGARIREQNGKVAENERKELLLLAEKCRLLLTKLSAKYPDEEDIADFKAFTEALEEELGIDREEETGFNMEDVIAPKGPLDLGELCRGLGLMEEDK